MVRHVVFYVTPCREFGGILNKSDGWLRRMLSVWTEAMNIGDASPTLNNFQVHGTQGIMPFSLLASSTSGINSS